MAYRLGYARTAFLVDDRPAAKLAYTALFRDYPKCVACIGTLGILAARDRDRSGMDSTVTQLDAVRGRFLFGRPLTWKARIAVASGDVTRGATLLSAAFASGAELDVLTHADPDLRHTRPDSIYRVFARVDE